MAHVQILFHVHKIIRQKTMEEAVAERRSSQEQMRNDSRVKVKGFRNVYMYQMSEEERQDYNKRNCFSGVWLFLINMMKWFANIFRYGMIIEITRRVITM